MEMFYHGLQMHFKNLIFPKTLTMDHMKVGLSASSWLVLPLFHGLHVMMNITSVHFHIFSIIAAAFAFIGKKYLMVSLAIPFIGGWVMLFFAKNALFLLIGRFLTGVKLQREYCIYTIFNLVVRFCWWCISTVSSSLHIRNSREKVQWSFGYCVPTHGLLWYSFC